MPRTRLACYAAVGFALLVCGVWGPARGDEAAAPAPAGESAGVPVRVEKVDGSVVEGKLREPTLRIGTPYGSLDLAMAAVRTMAVSVDTAEPTVVVDLQDRTQLHGKPLFAGLTVIKPDGSVERFTPGAVRQVVVVHKPETSVAALAIGLVTLSAMEIVLGIDNVIFLAIVAGRLPRAQQPKARRVGLAAALGTRIALLFSLTFLLGLTKPIFRIPLSGLDLEARDVSWRDLILLAGGAFLIGKSVLEMHQKLAEGHQGKPAADKPVSPAKAATSFARTIVQIAVIDIVFSLDSVITAVGMVDVLWVMITAMVIAMLVMLGFAGPIGEFVERHPTIKMLALSFLILIGVLLVAEGMGQHVAKGYIYFAMAFAVVMELINMRLRPKPVLV
jgi:predicted tellurium resistance membrane protein TerC